MAATVAAPLPLTRDFVAALMRRGIKRAGHVEGVFGAGPRDAGALRERLRMVLGEGVDDDLLGDWALQLEDFLPDVRKQALGDAERVVRVDRIAMEDSIRRRRLRDHAERPHPRAAAASELAWAPPPVKRWRTQRVARRAAGGDEPDARKRAEQEEHRKWAGQAAQLLLDIAAPVTNDGAGGAAR